MFTTSSLETLRLYDSIVILSVKTLVYISLSLTLLFFYCALLNTTMKDEERECVAIFTFSRSLLVDIYFVRCIIGEIRELEIYIF